MSDVEIPESHRDLLDVSTGVISTVNPNGYPHSTGVWFSYEDGAIKISAVGARQWFKNAKRTGKAAFLMIDPVSPPNRTLEIRGDATIEDDADLSYLGRQFAKYDIDVDTWRGPKADRQVLIIRPVAVHTWG
jgi:hypothetical protein